MVGLYVELGSPYEVSTSRVRFSSQKTNLKPTHFLVHLETTFSQSIKLLKSFFLHPTLGEHQETV